MIPFDLVAEVTFRAGRVSARRKAKRMIRSHPPPGEYRLLDGELGLGAGIKPAADLGVLALDVLAHDQHVDVFGPSIGQRRAHAFEQPGRAQVDILVEPPSDRDQHVPQRDVVGHARHADCAEKDRIAVGQAVQTVGGHDPAGPFVARTVPVERGPRQIDVEFCRGGLHDAQTLRDDLLADAVARDDGHAMRAHRALGPASRTGVLGATSRRRRWRARAPVSW